MYFNDTRYARVNLVPPVYSNLRCSCTFPSLQVLRDNAYYRRVTVVKIQTGVCRRSRQVANLPGAPCGVRSVIVTAGFGDGPSSKPAFLMPQAVFYVTFVGFKYQLVFQLTPCEFKGILSTKIGPQWQHLTQTSGGRSTSFFQRFKNNTRVRQSRSYLVSQVYRARENQLGLQR